MKDAAAQNMDMNAEIWRGCLSVIFAPNAVNVARYASLIWHKSPTKCGIHLPKSIFQTRSGDFGGRPVRQFLIVQGLLRIPKCSRNAERNIPSATGSRWLGYRMAEVLCGLCVVSGNGE